MMVTAIAAAPLFRLYAFAQHHNLWSNMILPFSCLDSLGGGALLAHCGDPHYGSSQRSKKLAAACGLWGVPFLFGLQAVITPLWNKPIGIFADYVLKDAALSMVAVWLIASATHGFSPPIGTVLNARPIRFLGTISYGIYLYHMFMLVIVPRGLKALNLDALSPWLVACIQVALSIGVATLSWFILEKPLNQLKRHFVYPPRQCDGSPTRSDA